jgi:hypothetical protein
MAMQQVMETVVHEERPPMKKKKSQLSDVETYGLKKAIVLTIVQSMKKHKKNLKNIHHWALHQWMIQDLGASKNVNHDFMTYAILALVEERIVNQYCEQMLANCPSAAWLRLKLANRLEPLQTGTTQYQFLDGINIKPFNKPEIRISSVINVQEFRAPYNEDRKHAKTLLKDIEESSVRQATPWTKELHLEIAATGE